MASSTIETNRKIRKRAKLHLFSVAVGVVTILLALDILGIGDNIRFYSKWLECGREPLVTENGYKGPSHYLKASEARSPLRGPLPYFCTPLDAELAGYSASPDSYYFPYLAQQSFEIRSQRKSLSEMSEELDKTSTRQFTTATIIFIVGGVTTAILYYKSRKIKV